MLFILCGSDVMCVLKKRVMKLNEVISLRHDNYHCS